MRPFHGLLRDFLSTLVVGALFCSSCSKDNTFSVQVSGKIIEPNSGTGIGGATVSLSASLISSGTYNSNYTEIATTITDAEGHYSFSQNIEGKAVGFRIAAFKNACFGNSVDLSSSIFENGAASVQDIYLYKEAFVKLSVHNQWPNDSTDKINFFYTSQAIAHCIQCCSDQITSGMGMAYSFQGTCKTYANQWTKIVWSVYKNQVLSVYSDSVYCNPSDTGQYSISY